MEISRYGHCVSAKLLSGLIVGALSELSAAAGVMVGKRLGRKEYDEAYTESKKIMYAGLAGAVAVFGIAHSSGRSIYRTVPCRWQRKRDWKDTADCVCLQRMYLSGKLWVCIHCLPRKKYSDWLYR